MINYPSRGKKREKFPFPSGTRLERPPVLSVLRAKSRELCRRQSQRSVGEEAVVGVAEELGARRGRGLLQQGSVEMSAALRGNFSTSSSSTRMLLHARHTLSLSLSLYVSVGNAVKNRRLRQSDPSSTSPYRPARHASYFFERGRFRSKASSHGESFRAKRMKGRIDELYEGGGGEFGFDSFGRRRLWKARSFNRILKGNLISGPRVKLRV